ncbi:phosphoglycerate mutase-like protein [Wolfiporia cocos MD-104 SS10]|uniref:Phosphoglycerate mutase-like protein n=1 Tax=Wolfiporia cocos (strain MD-104) TaxID=742152 RepID=A0A2H3JSF2_WOLCO|nr:phosphoglycerate mutase-like protein [Wolfiporia cocos MD-104 SS10]
MNCELTVVLRLLSLLLVALSCSQSAVFSLQTYMVIPEGGGPTKVTTAGDSSGRTKLGHVPLDVDGYPVAPPELELEQVHIYVRHGERTPVGVRMADPPASLPKHWMFCHTARNFHAAVASGSRMVPGAPLVAGQDGGTGEEESLRTIRIVERADGTAMLGECLLGELTDVGRQTTYDFGHALRQLYIDRLSFLPDIAKSNNEIYLRSTNVPRTVESLQQVTHGLYPETKSGAGFVPVVRIRNGKDENLFGNTLVCKRLEALQLGFAKAAAAEWNETLASLDVKLSKYIGGNPVRLDGKPRASGILDTIRAADAHGVNVPKEFREPGVMDLIEKAVVHEWFADKTEEVRRLGMGPLLSDLARKMQAKIEGSMQDPLKILIHSTHDTSLAALCSTLDVFDNRWPAFSSAVTFELFRRHNQSRMQPTVWQNVLAPFRRQRSDTSSEFYVRLRYQNRNLPLPACAPEGKHLPGSPEFCTFAAFRERVQELTPLDWEAECATTRGSPERTSNV